MRRNVSLPSLRKFAARTARIHGIVAVMRRKSGAGQGGRVVWGSPTTRLAAPLAAALCCAALAPAAADSSPVAHPPAARPPTAAPSLNERLWFREPARRQSQLSEIIVDQLTELGNQLGYHLDVLTMDVIALRVDGKRRRMSLGVGAGEASYLSLHFASDFHFVDGVARVSAHINLGIAGKRLDLQLPEVELVPASYKGERGVEVRLPIVSGRF